MKRALWEKKLKEQIKFDADFIPSFQTTIKILSEILEERDNVYTAYQKDGARPVIEFTSDRGAVNMKPNPLLKQWQELNTSALAYLRDLGLTAAGLRKLQGQIPERKSKKPSKLEAFYARRDGRITDEEEDYNSDEYWEAQFDMVANRETETPKNDKEKMEEMGMDFEEYAKFLVKDKEKWEKRDE